MATFTQMDVLLNIVGKLDCEVLDGDDTFPTWDMKSPLSVEIDADGMFVIKYNRDENVLNSDVKVLIREDGFVRWENKP